jgi:hypothetical protein
MRTQHTITNTFLFRVAQALLPGAMLLAFFGRRVPVAVRQNGPAMRRGSRRRR